MTDIVQQIEDALAGMTPGEYSVRQYGDVLEIRAADMTLIAEIGLFCSEDEQQAIRDDFAGIVALRNLTPALVAEVKRLREALEEYASPRMWHWNAAREVWEWNGDGSAYAIGTKEPPARYPAREDVEREPGRVARAALEPQP